MIPIFTFPLRIFYRLKNSHLSVKKKIENSLGTFTNYTRFNGKFTPNFQHLKKLNNKLTLILDPLDTIIEAGRSGLRYDLLTHLNRLSHRQNCDSLCTKKRSDEF